MKTKLFSCLPVGGWTTCQSISRPSMLRIIHANAHMPTPLCILPLALCMLILSRGREDTLQHVLWFYANVPAQIAGLRKKSSPRRATASLSKTNCLNSVWQQDEHILKISITFMQIGSGSCMVLSCDFWLPCSCNQPHNRSACRECARTNPRDEIAGLLIKLVDSVQIICSCWLSSE